MLSLSANSIKRFTHFIKDHKSFVIAGHKEPDGDCISSSLVLAKILDHYKKPYQILSAGPFKRPETKKYESRFAKEYTAFCTEQPKPGLFIVDCSDITRLGDVQQSLPEMDIFIIDHHKSSEKIDSQNSIIDSSAPAVACIMQLLYEECVGIPNEEIAKLLFFGLSTDTGFFRFLDSQSSDVFQAASRLVSAGANPRVTYDEITSGKPFNTRKLLGIMLDRAKQYCNNKLIVTYELMEDTYKYGREGRDSDMLYSILLAVEGVQAVVFLRQETDVNCTIGLRSRDEIDVSKVAEVFGGGGHKNASGSSTQGTISSILPILLKEFDKIL